MATTSLSDHELPHSTGDMLTPDELEHLSVFEPDQSIRWLGEGSQNGSSGNGSGSNGHHADATPESGADASQTEAGKDVRSAGIALGMISETLPRRTVGRLESTPGDGLRPGTDPGVPRVPSGDSSQASPAEPSASASMPPVDGNAEIMIVDQINDAPTFDGSAPVDESGGDGVESARSPSLHGAPFVTPPSLAAALSVDDMDARAERVRELVSLSAAANDFILYDQIGRGGQGHVWRAWQTSLSREVAVKQSHAGDLLDFLHEAYTSAELDHPNIVPIYDMGAPPPTDKGGPLLAMKLVRGETWIRLMRRERHSRDFDFPAFLARHLRILLDVTNAVAYAHSKGIIHRDLKPHQVMVGAFGEVYLMDWGMAVSLSDDVPTSSVEGVPKFRAVWRTNNCSGTPIYMAPEQTRRPSDVLGRHTDIYLLGAILYEIVAGRGPHFALTAKEAYQRACTNDCDELPAGCPIELRELINQSLATAAAERPPSAEEFRDAIEAYLNGSRRRIESRDITATVVKELTAAEVRADRLSGEEWRAVTSAADDAPIARNSGSNVESLPIAYPVLTEWRARLMRALVLWPENEEAAELADRLHTRHARLAIGQGDLVLAGTLLDTMPAEAADRAKLRGELAAARTRVARSERSRRVAFVAVIGLLIALLGSGALIYHDRRTAAMEIATREARVEEQTRLADLLGEANALIASESALVEEFNQIAPMPTFIDDGTPIARSLRARVAKPLGELIDLRRQLAADRRRLERDLPESEKLIGQEPFALLLAEATAALYGVTSTPVEASIPLTDYLVDEDAATDFERLFLAISVSRDLFEEAVARRPNSVEANTGLAFATFYSGDSIAAARIFETAAELVGDRNGRDSLEYSDALALAGEAASFEASLEDATLGGIPFFERSSEILRPRWERMSTQLAGRMMDASQYRRALELTSNALELRRDEGLATDSTREDMVDLYTELLIRNGHFDEAWEFLDRYEADLNKAIASGKGDWINHKTWLDFALNRASVLNRLGKLEESLEQYKEARRIAVEKDGTVFGAYAYIILFQEAQTLLLLGRYEEADSNLVELLQWLESLKKTGTIQYADTLYQIGNIAIFTQETKRAIHYLERANIIYSRLLSADHLKVIQGQFGLGRLYLTTRRNEEAVEILERVIVGAREIYGPTHPHVSAAGSALAEAYFRVGEEEKSIALKQEVITNSLTAVGLDHPDTITELLNYSGTLANMEQFDEAIVINSYCLAMMRTMLGPRHPFTMVVHQRAISVPLLTIVDGVRPDPVGMMRLAAEFAAHYPISTRPLASDDDLTAVLTPDMAVFMSFYAAEQADDDGDEAAETNIVSVDVLKTSLRRWQMLQPLSSGYSNEDQAIYGDPESEEDDDEDSAFDVVRSRSRRTTPTIARELAARFLTEEERRSLVREGERLKTAMYGGAATVDDATDGGEVDVSAERREPLPWGEFKKQVDEIVPPIDWPTAFPVITDWSIDPGEDELDALRAHILGIFEDGGAEQTAVIAAE